MGARTNIIFDDEVWEALQQAPRGERSRIVNQAVAEWLKRHRAEEACQVMDAIAARAPAQPGSAADWIREDRGRPE